MIGAGKHWQRSGRMCLGHTKLTVHIVFTYCRCVTGIHSSVLMRRKRDAYTHYSQFYPDHMMFKAHLDLFDWNCTTVECFA